MHVRSVGTLDVGSLPALPAAVKAAARIGIDLSRHRARPLRIGELGSADLVVGFEPGNISAAVVDGRADPARTFSLVELGLLLEIQREEKAPHRGEPASVIQAAHGRRPTSFLQAPRIADPRGASDSVFARTVSLIDHHVSTIAEVVLVGAETAV